MALLRDLLAIVGIKPDVGVFSASAYIAIAFVIFRALDAVKKLGSQTVQATWEAVFVVVLLAFAVWSRTSSTKQVSLASADYDVNDGRAQLDELRLLRAIEDSDLETATKSADQLLAGVGELSEECCEDAVRFFARRGDLVRAELWLERRLELDSTSGFACCNAVVNACLQAGDVARAEKWIVKVAAKGASPMVSGFGWLESSASSSSGKLAVLQEE
eukprot:TRINITY_DN17171_c1_g5_i1.p1 TRINITY_DN17171_c1_g5~~TRINITY_DN17171_c1_g5_i1.p1  ORF type:complete len:240 (-),score=65.31 TRINITY_DN17171_c1_g5_i1:186-836(-)